MVQLVGWSNGWTQPTVQVKYKFLGSNENDFEIFGFFLNFNIDFS
jgi:hypothetical protein